MQRFLVSFLILSLSVPVYAGFSSDIQQAQRAFTKQDFDLAIDNLQQALTSATSPAERAQAHNALGWTLFKQKRYSQAKQHLEQALSLAKQVGDEVLARKASNNLGVLAYTTGNYEQAQSQFSAAPSQQSTAASTYLSLIQKQQTAIQTNDRISQGVALARQGNFAAAIGVYDQALEADPNNVRLLEFKGYALFRTGQSAAAIKVQQHALTLEPGRQNLLINMLKAYCNLGDDAGRDAFYQANKLAIAKHINVIKSDRELSKHCGSDFVDRL